MKNNFINNLKIIVSATEGGNEIKFQEFDLSTVEQSKFSNAWKIYQESNVCLYRGIRDSRQPEISVMTPGTRISQNTANYYTWMVSDFFDEWHSFPPRNKSFICSTSRNYAKIYGEIYLIFPENNLNLGICPKADIWGSFQNVEKTLEISELPQMNHMIKKMILKKKLSPTIDEKGFKQFLETTSLGELMNLINSQDKNDMDTYLNPDKFKRLLKTFGNITTLFEMFQKIMNPKLNKFELRTVEEFLGSLTSPTKSKEVWMSGDCLTISEYYLQEYQQTQS